EVRALLDGHFYLKSSLSHVQHYPAIDLLSSNSRLMLQLVDERHLRIAERLKRLWAIYEQHRDLISLGAYRRGSDPAVDEAIQKREILARFLTQRPEESVSLEDTLALAEKVLDG
ncbi:MAG: flagellum-specific ATP synthase FliI, partial [Deltaproteobacteria bacterium]|nr:flagellum-specific ATP synthase FliI [Deltaproteobacteria bacterium]